MNRSDQSTNCVAKVTAVCGADVPPLLNNTILQLLGAPNRRAVEEFAALVGDVTADEIMALGPKDQVLFMEGIVYRLRRVHCFEEERFAGHDDPLGRSSSR